MLHRRLKGIDKKLNESPNIFLSLLQKRFVEKARGCYVPRKTFMVPKIQVQMVEVRG